MKFNIKSLLITILLLLGLWILITIEANIFISGPKLKYEDSIQQQIDHIEKQHAANIINRHVFHYIVYVGENSTDYIWFNEKGQILTKRELSSYKPLNVEDLVRTKYDLVDVEVNLGYGNDKPVYVIDDDRAEILLDYDSLDEIYYLKKG